MKILAFDTSANACSIALAVGDTIRTAHIHAPMQQAKLLLPTIDEMLKYENIELKQLDAIAFGCGPGSFTGIRIATSVAQGLGYALNKPLVPISSLAAIAQAAYDELGWKKLFVAIDARIQEIYSGQYIANEAGLVELQGLERVCAPQDLTHPCDEAWCGVGNAWEVYRKDLPFMPLQVDSMRSPIASAIIKLAILRIEAHDWVDASKVLPVYLRDEVAMKEKKR